MRYGHLCTHRCDDHWNWNLEIEEVYFAKDKGYAKVFVETNEMTREIVTVMLKNGNVRVRSESDAPMGKMEAGTARAGAGAEGRRSLSVRDLGRPRQMLLRRSCGFPRLPSPPMWLCKTVRLCGVGLREPYLV